MTPQEMTKKLEYMVDAFGLQTVLDTLATVCAEKADHIQTNWQDEKLAKVWQRHAKRINATADALR